MTPGERRVGERIGSAVYRNCRRDVRDFNAGRDFVSNATGSMRREEFRSTLSASGWRRLRRLAPEIIETTHRAVRRAKRDTGPTRLVTVHIPKLRPTAKSDNASTPPR